MESVFSNGGVIGATLDYNSTAEYTDHASSTINGYLEPVFVGGGTWTATSISATNTVTFPSLTGGVASTPAQGDVVVVAFGFSGTTDLTIGTSSAGWAEISEAYVNDTEDTQLAVYYKVMGSTPDTNIIITSNQSDTASSPAALIQVWRNIDTTTPIDVTSVQSNGSNSLIPAFGVITPITPNAIILAIAAGAFSGTPAAYSSSLANFFTVITNDTEDLTMGFGSYSGWTSGAYAADSWTVAGDSTASSYATLTIALRPAFGTIPSYNKKNSGIWNLEAVFDATAPAYSTAAIEYLVIAGGGGAGLNSNDSGGGGAGGYRSSVSGEMSGGGASAESPLTITFGTPYTVTVGAGGASDANGSNSVFASITSIGGGKGAQGGGSTAPGGSAGGSGGGGNNGTVGNLGSAGTAGQGYAGGDGATDSGGGGGAGGAGGNGPAATPAGTSAGGAGVTSSITGTAIARAGGGGGGNDNAGNGTATAGGGAGSTGAIGTAGTANTGGGGGGAGGTGGTTAAAGGSGIVIIRYSSTLSPTISAGLTSTTTTIGANKVTVFTAGTGTVTF